MRAKLRKLGVKFGAYHIYVPLALKPAPRELALILYALKNGGLRQPGVSELPHTVLSGRTSFQIDPEISTKLYEVAGFKVAGKRAVRVDILERLADIIRPLIALDARRHQGELPAGAAEGNGFRVTVEMTSLLGTAGEDFASILTSLGYRVRRTPKVPQSNRRSRPRRRSTPLVETVADRDARPRQRRRRAASSPTARRPKLRSRHRDRRSRRPGATWRQLSLNQSNRRRRKRPAEPEFDEIWFPGGRRPDNAPRHQNRRPHRDEAAPDRWSGAGGPSATPLSTRATPRRCQADGAQAGRASAETIPAAARASTSRASSFGDDKKPVDGGKKFAGKRDGETGRSTGRAKSVTCRSIRIRPGPRWRRSGTQSPSSAWPSSASTNGCSSPAP